MKRVFSAILFLAVLAGFNSCKKENSPGNAASNCKITAILTNGSGDLQSADPYTSITNEKIDYNDKNLQSGFTSQSSTLYKSKKTATYSYSNNYQYDANGFVIKQVAQSSSTDKAGVYTSNNYTTMFEYTNNRLTKSTSTGVSITGGKTVNSTGTVTYEYTTDGKLSKYANVYSGSDGSSSNGFVLYEYSNGKVSKYSYSSGSSIITPLIELNSQGYVTKLVTSTDETRNTYDAEGNRIRQEQWSGGKKTDIRIITLDNKQNAYALYAQPLKGQPDFSFFSGHFNISSFTHNVTRDEYIYVSPAGVEIPQGHSDYTYQYNGNNLPTAVDIIYTDGNGKASQQYSKSYTYTGCQ